MELARNALKEYMPPKIWDWFRCQFGGFRLVDGWPMSPGGGWNHAASEAAKGYDDGVRRMTGGSAVGFLPTDELTDWQDNTKQLHDRMIQLALVVARAASGCEELRILDFGGGFGTHVKGISRLLPKVRCNYTVCDLAEFCEIGRKLNEHVRFVSSLQEAGEGFHLVYASGSVQYLSDWRNLIAELCKASTASVFITRTPFVYDRSTFVTVQRAYSTEYPGWVFNFQEFVQEFSRHNMVLEEVFVNGRGIPVRGAGKPNIHLGLLFDRRSMH